ncbi:recombinase family protein, partial [Shigella sonnei]
VQIVGSFAEFERAMLRERTKSGLAAARQDGLVSGEKTHHGGRVNPKQTGGISTCFLPRCDERDNLFLLLGC